MPENYSSPQKDGIVSLYDGLVDALEAPARQVFALSLALQSLQKQTHKSITD